MSVSRAKHGQGALPPSFGLPRDIFGKKNEGCFARETSGCEGEVL